MYQPQNIFFPWEKWSMWRWNWNCTLYILNPCFLELASLNQLNSVLYMGDVRFIVQKWQSKWISHDVWIKEPGTFKVQLLNATIFGFLQLRGVKELNIFIATICWFLLLMNDDYGLICISALIQTLVTQWIEASQSILFAHFSSSKRLAEVDVGRERGEIWRQADVQRPGCVRRVRKVRVDVHRHRLVHEVLDRLDDLHRVGGVIEDGHFLLDDHRHRLINVDVHRLENGHANLLVDGQGWGRQQSVVSRQQREGWSVGADESQGSLFQQQTALVRQQAGAVGVEAGRGKGPSGRDRNQEHLENKFLKT